MLLALKYRPLFFRDVLGQDDTIKVLKQNILSKDIRPVYMFVGSYGSGKTTIARIFARALMCPNQQDGEPCNTCESCISSINGKNLNFLEIDAATHGKIENVRQLKEDASYVPLGISKYKIICLDECHEMKKAAQNALLKQMEETPETSVYVLCTTEPEKMLNTVLSRSFVFPIRKIPYKIITDRLEHICKTENLEYEREALELIVAAEKGHVRDIIGKVDLLSTFGKITCDLVREELDLDLDDTFLEILKNLGENPSRSLELTEKVLNRVEPSKIYNGLAKKSLDIYRASLVQRAGPDLEVFKILGLKVLKIADYFLDRKRTFDETTLLCDILLIGSKVQNGFEDVRLVSAPMLNSTLSQNSVSGSNPSTGQPVNKPVLKSFDDQFKSNLDIIGSKPPEAEKSNQNSDNKSLSKRFEILSSKRFSLLLVGSIKEWLENVDG